jgi:S1-C subfamily serine protease
VIHNSPAHRAGIQIGDKVLKLGDWTVDDSLGLHQRILGSEGTIDVTVKHLDVEAPVQLQVTLNGKPIRLGVSFRADESEPGTLLVIQVTRASPADIAGVKPRDRIYKIGGQSFANSTEFLELSKSQPTPVTLTLENRGQLREVTLNALPAVAKRENDAAAVSP